jgi:hypothetical protein
MMRNAKSHQYENKGFNANGEVEVKINDPVKDEKRGKKKKEKEPPLPTVGVLEMVC